MQKEKGFTLIEVMIVVVVIGILASIAYPSYTEYVFKARRVDGQSALMAIELEQQKRRAAGVSVETDVTALGFSTGNSFDGHYKLAISDSGDIFTATPQGKQLSDSCGVLSIVDGGSPRYQAGSGEHAKCWGR